MRRSPQAAILAALVTRLRASTGLTALATGGIYNHVPQNTPYPYIEVSSPTDRRQDTMGRFGAETLVDLKAVSVAMGDLEAAQMIDQCQQSLQFAAVAMSGHASLGITWESTDRFSEIVNGIRVRHHVATCRVWTEQSTS